MERYTATQFYRADSPESRILGESGLVPSEFVLAEDAQRALDAERERVAKLEKIQAIDLKNNNEYRQQLATLQAQLADRDAMILQMGEQAAVLAKENMAVKAQLRQVEGELAYEKTAYKKLSEQWNKDSLDLTTLRQLLEDVLHTFGYLRLHRVAGMDGLLYETHNKMSPERTVEACEKRIRATLAAQDAGAKLPAWANEAMRHAPTQTNPPHPTEERHE